MNFINIDGSAAGSKEIRRSTLDLRDGRIEVIGNLPHAYSFTPASVEDAMKLRSWLDEWINRTVFEMKEAL